LSLKTLNNRPYKTKIPPPPAFKEGGGFWIKVKSPYLPE